MFGVSLAQLFWKKSLFKCLNEMSVGVLPEKRRYKESLTGFQRNVVSANKNEDNFRDNFDIPKLFCSVPKSSIDF